MPDVVPLDGALVPAVATLCAESLARTTSLIGAPWLEPPASPDLVAETMVRSFVDGAADGRFGWAVVDGSNGTVLGFAGATVVELTPEDWRFTFMPPRSVGVANSALHLHSAADPAIVYPLLLDATRRLAAEGEIPRVMMPTRSWDSAAEAVWRQHGLTPDACMAARRVDTWKPARGVAAGVRVRVAGPDDVEGLTDLALEEHLYHAQHTGAGTSPDQPRETSRRLAADAVSGGDGMCQLVAEDVDGGALLGSVVGTITDVADDQVSRFLLPARYGYIGLTSVTAGARGRGIGGVLVDELMRWFAGHELELSFLHYVVDNPLSAPFWSGLGFQPHIGVSTLRA